MRHDYDSYYKKLFSHPQMVRDLLLEFVPGDWVNEVDFSTLTPVKCSFVTEGVPLQQRHGDLLWKIRLKNSQWVYVYLMLEFQSSIDKFMSLRMLSYLVLLYEDLLRRKELDAQGVLPAVLPIVLYNGSARWSAPLALQDLIAAAPAGLELDVYVPNFHYLIIDERTYGPEALNALHNLVAAMFRLETQNCFSDWQQALNSLIEWLADDSLRPLRQTFAVWISQLLKEKMPGEFVKELHELQEIKDMLAENIDSWFAEHEKKGLEKGLQQGLQQGWEKGVQQGLQQGEMNGEVKALKLMLCRRFGVVPAEIETKISQASVQQIENWLLATMNAERLSDVFAEQ